jgi:hypothetical protein
LGKSELPFTRHNPFVPEVKNTRSAGLKLLKGRQIERDKNTHAKQVVKDNPQFRAF